MQPLPAPEFLSDERPEPTLVLPGLYDVYKEFTELLDTLERRLRRGQNPVV
ncbi:MAG: hypothetical protein JJT90_05885 [Ectothiorhodospiraceae bacterium]|nr:hypothetical protein [Ectothiorhodospiraceae bacterium]